MRLSDHAASLCLPDPYSCENTKKDHYLNCDLNSNPHGVITRLRSSLGRYDVVFHMGHPRGIPLNIEETAQECI